jgi:hypothetical protein
MSVFEGISRNEVSYGALMYTKRTDFEGGQPFKVTRDSMSHKYKIIGLRL